MKRRSREVILNLGTGTCFSGGGRRERASTGRKGTYTLFGRVGKENRRRSKLEGGGTRKGRDKTGGERKGPSDVDSLGGRGRFKHLSRDSIENILLGEEQTFKSEGKAMAAHSLEKRDGEWRDIL